MAIRLKIREVMEAQGMSQRKLSRLTGIDIKNIQRIWRNDRANITMETLGRLAKALGVDGSQLIESIEDDKSS